MTPLGALVPALPSAERPAWREYGVLLLLIAAAFLACWKPLSDPDTYWHLALGRQIWHDHALVRSETFSFTEAGAPWVDTEWLFHAAAFPLWKTFGDLGLKVLTALMGALGIALAYRTVRLMGGDAPTLALFLLPTLWAYADRVRFRPDILSLAFLAILCEMIQRWRPRLTGAGRFPWEIPTLFLLWVQVHGAWAFGMVLLWAFIAGAILDAVKASAFDRRFLLRVLAPGAASAAAVLVTPYGGRLALFPLQHLLSFRDPSVVRIAEWSRTPFAGVYGPFAVAALASLACVLIFRRRFAWADFLPAASQVILGLYWVRYAACTVVALAGAVTSRLAPLRTRGLWSRILPVAGALCAAGMLVWAALGASSPLDLKAKYPVEEASFVRDHLAGGNLFHEFKAGGYLEWTLPSSFKVLMDGRLLFAQGVAPAFVEAHRTPEAFREFLARQPIDCAIYPYPGFQLSSGKGGPPRGPSAVLFPEKDWSLVALGPYGMVLLKREPKNEAVVAKFGYAVLRPDDLPYLVGAASRGTVSRAALQGDLRRASGGSLPSELAVALQSTSRQLEAQERGTHAP